MFGVLVQHPSEIPPEQHNVGHRTQFTLDRVVHGLLWILLAVTIGLNTWLNLFGYHMLAMVFGFVAIGIGVIVFIRFLKSRAS